MLPRINKQGLCNDRPFNLADKTLNESRKVISNQATLEHLQDNLRHLFEITMSHVIYCECHMKYIAKRYPNAREITADDECWLPFRKTGGLSTSLAQM